MTWSEKKMEDYLALRQQLKQSIRERPRREESGVKAPSTTTAMPKPTSDAAALVKAKARWLKESRDYSFLYPASEAQVEHKNRKIKLIIKWNSKGSLNEKQPDKTDSVNRPKIITRAKVEESSRLMNSSEVQRREKKQGIIFEKSEQKESEGRKGKVRNGEGGDGYNGIKKTIREMFHYHPTSFSEDEGDDLKMVASFAEIEKEEKRSAKIARKEDRGELSRLENKRRKKIM